MAIFLSDEERTLINEQRKTEPMNRFYWALLDRAQKRAQSPGIIGFDTSVHYWHAVAEYMTDAAMAYALKPERDLGIWLRDTTLSLVRRDADDWVGPWFRNHDTELPLGHLETAHLCLAVAAPLDLAPDVFIEAEREEITAKLRDEGIPMCLRWLENRGSLNNWHCIMTFGLASAAAVLDDRVAMQKAVEYFNICVQAYQPDGTYTESLQYSNYASQGLMLAYEALVRRDPSLAKQISAVPYAKGVPWSLYSYFYKKPLTKWGPYPLPRSANFNDSAAIHRPTADVLLHMAVRAQDELPTEAGLATWLFEELYLPYVDQVPYDLMSFGFFNQFGFLAMPLMVHAPAAISPVDTDLPTMAHFSCGDTLVRERWGGRTILAVHGASEPNYGPGHLHGDINSFILVHNQERLLLDPGHACYRSLTRELDVSTKTHNTCTFLVEPDATSRPEDKANARLLQQSTTLRRLMVDGQPTEPVERGGQHLLSVQEGSISVVGSEAAALYGAPIESFKRFFILCREHALFIIDHITSSQPVRTTWNWLLNNRDGGLNVKLFPPDRLVARRGDAGIKLFHLGGGQFQGPVYAHVHDAYHPLPDQPSEGRAGSGMLYRWQERTPQRERTVIHVIPVDHYGAIAGWHLRQFEDGRTGLEAPNGTGLWTVHVEGDHLQSIIIRDEGKHASYRVAQTHSQWHLELEN